MYRWLVGNLRLWRTIQTKVVIIYIMKLGSLNKEFSYYIHLYMI